MKERKPRFGLQKKTRAVFSAPWQKFRYLTLNTHVSRVLTSNSQTFRNITSRTRILGISSLHLPHAEYNLPQESMNATADGVACLLFFEIMESSLPDAREGSRRDRRGGSDVLFLPRRPRGEHASEQRAREHRWRREAHGRDQSDPIGGRG